MLKNSIRLSIITSLLLGLNIYAEDGFDDEDEFGSDDVIEVVKTQKEDDTFTYYGSVSYSSNYSYKNTLNKVTSSKLSGDLNLEYKLNDNYKIKSNIKAYKDDKSNANKEDSDINELYLQGKISNNYDITLGRQIVVWGKSDNIRITDTLNPMDLTTPGMVDIKDLRLGRAMSKFDFYMQDWTFSSIILHENRYNMKPEFGSEYTTQNQTSYNKMQVEEPSSSIKNSGIAFSLSANLQGQDVAFYGSNQYIDGTTYRSNMLGFAYNIVKDSFLYKTEVAYFDNYDSDTISSKTDGLAGVEYTGISDGSVSFELANKDDTIQYALRFTQSYINETVDFTALINGYGKELEDGGFSRVWLDYDYNDDIKLTMGVIDYFGGDDPKFELMKNNDRVFGSVKYSF